MKTDMIAFDPKYVIMVKQHGPRLFISFVDGNDFMVLCNTPEKAQEIFKAIVGRISATYEIQDGYWE